MAPHFTLTFLIVCDEGLGERLPDGVDLAGVAASLHADAHIDTLKTGLAEKQDAERSSASQEPRSRKKMPAAEFMEGVCKALLQPLL